MSTGSKVYQLVIKDSNGFEQYISTGWLSEDQLSEYNIKSMAQHEHLLRNPDDRMLDQEFLDEIFAKINVIGLVPVVFNPVNI